MPTPNRLYKYEYYEKYSFTAGLYPREFFETGKKGIDL